MPPELERLLPEIITERTRVVAFAHVSNVLGTIAPVAELVAPEVTAAQVDHVITMGRLQEQEALAAGALLFGRAAKQRWPYEPISAE